MADLQLIFSETKRHGRVAKFPQPQPVVVPCIVQQQSNVLIVCYTLFQLSILSLLALFVLQDSCI